MRGRMRFLRVSQSLLGRGAASGLPGCSRCSPSGGGRSRPARKSRRAPPWPSRRRPSIVACRSSDTHGFCSVCYKAHQSTATLAASSPSPAAPAAAATAAAPAVKPAEPTPQPLVEEAAVPPAAAAAVAESAASPPPADDKPVQVGCRLAWCAFVCSRCIVGCCQRRLVGGIIATVFRHPPKILHLHLPAQPHCVLLPQLACRKTAAAASAAARRLACWALSAGEQWSRGAHTHTPAWAAQEIARAQHPFATTHSH